MIGDHACASGAFSPLTSLAKAIAWIETAVTGPLQRERLPIGDVRGRVLGAELWADRDSPPFDRSTVDGYALAAGSTLGASPYNPLTFFIREEGRTVPNAAVVALGSPLPRGFDAVIPPDHVETDAARESFQIVEPMPPGANVERAGAEFHRGTLLLTTGTRLEAQHIGLLAELGANAVEVIRRPHARVVVTSSNLIEPGQYLPNGAVFDADTAMLRALIERDGGTVEVCFVDRTKPGAVLEAVAPPGADLVIVVGGSGKGMDDQIIRNPLGSSLGEHDDGLSIHAVALRPGSSSGVGMVGGKLTFLLPGMPAGCLWGYEILAGPAVRRLGGHPANLPYVQREFVTTRKIVSRIGFVEVMLMRCLTGTEAVEPLATTVMDGSSGLAGAAGADGFVLIPEASEGFSPGSRVCVFLYERQRPYPDCL